MASTPLPDLLAELKRLGERQRELTVDESRVLITVMTHSFTKHLLTAGYDKRKIRALTTKFRDSSRRSAPWKPASSKVPGRPQDGADGNRRARWLFAEDHKFYASEIDATLVEVKYYLQALSMEGAPPLPDNTIQDTFNWLTGHPIVPGRYLDPIQKIPIDFREFIENPRGLQSGHFVPLDRTGKHVPANTFLMLSRSNQLQGNLTLDELIDTMERIVRSHRPEAFAPPAGAPTNPE